MYGGAEQTIVAPATPPGEGGLAVLRLSGILARDLLSGVFRASNGARELKSHRLYHGHIVDDSGEVLDEVMAVFMQAPRTFTREDVAEIHCHGGPLIVQGILDLLLSHGAVMARPGEFTLRAFLNGRLDLAQAEAVADLIHAHSRSAQRVALGQLRGRLSTFLGDLRQKLVDLLALVEAHIDFLEEDISPPNAAELCTLANDVANPINQLLAGFNQGRLLQEGMRILLAGKPNVGKSSLLNALLGESRAIVSSAAGTTRDTIEESLVLHGLPIRLIDTAGLRHTSDPVELEGVKRARDKVAGADLILLLVDGSCEPDEDDLLALEACRSQRVLLVINKCDLAPPPALSGPWVGLPNVCISAKHGEHIDELIDAIREQVGLETGQESGESVLVYERRHYQALLQASACLKRFVSGCNAGFGFELLALDLRDALQAVGQITGETTPDEVLEHIFGKFCIGK